MLHRDDDLASIAKGAVCIYFSWGRSFARDAAQVDGENGVYLMQIATALREKILTPSTRRAPLRYWVNFQKEFPLDTCEAMMGDLREVDASCSSTFQADADSFPKEMTHRKDHLMDASYDLNTAQKHPVGAEGGTYGRPDRAVTIDERADLLIRAHRGEASNTQVRTYKIWKLPANAIPGLQDKQP